jgi:CRP-like cAMP-binding protein
LQYYGACIRSDVIKYIWIFCSGEVKVYRGEDLGETKQLLKCPVKPTLYLKKNAPVMLYYKNN